MAAARKARSAAQKVDEAYKFILSMQEKYGFPKVLTEKEVSGDWAQGYGMKSLDMANLRAALSTFNTYMGPMRWPEESEE